MILISKGHQFFGSGGRCLVFNEEDNDCTEVGDGGS